MRRHILSQQSMESGGEDGGGSGGASEGGGVGVEDAPTCRSMDRVLNGSANTYFLFCSSSSSVRMATLSSAAISGR